MNFVSQLEESLRDLGSQARSEGRASANSSAFRAGGYLPILKEASERGLLTLRKLQGNYAAQVRKAAEGGYCSSDQPTTRIFCNQDLLRPFLFACNFSEAPENLVEISINAIQLLLSAEAVFLCDAVQIVRILTIQSSNVSLGEKIRLHMLQICTVVINYTLMAELGAFENEQDKVLDALTEEKGNIDGLNEELFTQACVLCLKLAQSSMRRKVTSQMGSMWTAASSTLSGATVGSQEQKAKGIRASTSMKTIRRASNATLRQLVSMIFDKVCSVVTTDREGISTRQQKRLEVEITVASKLFMDLCMLAEAKCGGDDGVIKGSGPLSKAIQQTNLVPLPRSMSLELLDGILSQNKALFSSACSISETSFPILLRSIACPIVTTILLSDCYSSVDITEDLGDNRIEEEPSLNDKDEEFLKSQQRIESNGEKVGIEAFSLLIRSVHIAKTIILTYGHYEDFGGECHILLSSLLRFLTRLSEVYRGFTNFEDAYIYNEITRSSDQHDGDNFFVPSMVLWPAALSVEVIHSIVSDTLLLPKLNTSYDAERPTSTVITSLAEALQDFAIISTSNKTKILEFVAFVEKNRLTSGSEYSPRFFVDAKESAKSYDAWESGRSSKGAQHSNHSQGGPHLESDLISVSGCRENDMIYGAYRSILLLLYALDDIVSSLSKNDKSGIDLLHSLVECTCVSIDSTLRHFFSRLSNSSHITKQICNAYVSLSHTIFSVNDMHSQIRRTILPQLCNMMHFNKKLNTNVRHVTDCNIEVLSGIFHIVQLSCAVFTVEDWQYIVELLQEIAPIPISSKDLSDEGKVTAHSLAKAYARLPTFTATLTQDSLCLLIKAFVRVSISNQFASRPTTTAANLSQTYQSETEDSKQDIPAGISNRLIDFAGRAMNGFTSSNVTDDYPSSQQIPQSNVFCHDFYEETNMILDYRKIADQESWPGKLNFTLVALTGIALANIHRLKTFWSIISDHYIDIANEMSKDERNYAINAMGALVNASLSTNNESYATIVKARLAPSVDSFFDVDIFTIDKNEIDTNSLQLSQLEIVTPLCTLLTTAKSPDVAKLGLESTLIVLESAGHELEGDTWTHLITSLSSLSGTSSFDSKRLDESWKESCVAAFSCLQLIVNDYLDHLPSSPDRFASECRIALLDCCSSFGSSKHDVNVSFTATGLLWTLADHDPSPTSVKISVTKLIELSRDERTEVRNVSLQSLISLIVGLGSAFTPDQWRNICNVLLHALLFTSASEDDVEITSDISNEEYPLFVHHSRNTKSKQWEGTHELMLRGLERILRQFFYHIVIAASSEIERNVESLENELFKGVAYLVDFPPNEWLVVIWKGIINVSLATGTGAICQETRQAAIDLLLLCSQISSIAGVKEVTNHVRVGTNMQVIDGALRSVREANISDISHDMNLTQKSLRYKLFTISFYALQQFTKHLVDLSTPVHFEQPTFSIYLISDEVSIQVYSKFSSGLLNLYQCCKSNELAPRSRADERDEATFLDIVMIVLGSFYERSQSQFLTQGQRLCIEILITMIKNSSLLAFNSLASIASDSFVISRENAGKSGGETATDTKFKIISKEASKEIMHLFTDPSTPKDLLLHMSSCLTNMLLQLLQRKRSKSLFISSSVMNIVEVGLDSVASETDAAVHDVWMNVINILQYTFSPINVGQGGLDVTAKDFLPRFLEIPTALSSSAISMLSQALSVYTHALFDIEGHQGGIDNMQQIFETFKAIFSTLVRLSPLDNKITEATNLLLSRYKDLDEISHENDIGSDSVVFICTQLNCDETTIPISMFFRFFHHFSKLIGSENEKIANISKELYSKVDLQGEYQSQIERVKEAEDEISRLQAENQQLVSRVHKLQEEVLALGGASSAWF